MDMDTPYITSKFVCFLKTRISLNKLQVAEHTFVFGKMYNTYTKSVGIGALPCTRIDEQRFLLANITEQ